MGTAKLVGMMPVRNEAWIVGLSARVALMWCDELVVLDHASIDATPQILAELTAESGRLMVIREENPTWAEMDHRQRLLEVARERGATHCAIVDADEILTGPLISQIKALILATTSRGRVFCLPMFAMWRSLERYRWDTSVWSHRSISLAFADNPDLCYRATNGYQLHHREPHGSVPLPAPAPALGGVMHLQWANWRRLTAKHALYKMQEVARWPGRSTVRKIDRMYSLALDERRITLAQTPAAWWAPYRGLIEKHYRPEETPWQEIECATLWRQYGPQPFQGLNLYGVAEMKGD